MLVRVPRQVLRYAIGEEERKALMRRTWETKLEKFGVVNIRVEKCISIVDLWRAIFSTEAAMRIARRCKKLHGDTLSASKDASTFRSEARLKVLVA